MSILFPQLYHSIQLWKKCMRRQIFSHLCSLLLDHPRIICVKAVENALIPALPLLPVFSWPSGITHISPSMFVKRDPDRFRFMPQDQGNEFTRILICHFIIQPLSSSFYRCSRLKSNTGLSIVYRSNNK